MLKEAGLEEADVCIVATDGDNTNLVVAQLAREEFGVECVVARVFDPHRARFYGGAGHHRGLPGGADGGGHLPCRPCLTKRGWGE